MTRGAELVTLGDCHFEILSREDVFLGLGAIRIGTVPVRSGRLPLTVATQSFDGWELKSLKLREVLTNPDEVRIRLGAEFLPLPVRLMRDHSFDPIHDTNDWDATAASRWGELDLVLRLVQDSFNGVSFSGFSYGYEYQNEDVELFYLLDKASWELEGDIQGATVYSQSACSAPVVTFDRDNAWSTEGMLFFLVEQNQNPVMTHNLPRWASHGSFDFQFKGNHTLIGLFERVELIRSIQQRDAGKAELKTFDKHIFDQTGQFATSRKCILLNSEPKTVTDQQNLWTWIHTAVEERARGEFGLKEEPLKPRISVNYWSNFSVDTYYRDLLPAAKAVGIREVFIDNLKKSAMTEKAPLPGVFNWNMCCSHEYEIAPALGGNEGVSRFVATCREHDIRPVSWTCNTQALSSPVNGESDTKGWYVLLEDARQKFGGAYNAVMSVLDLTVDEARRYFVDSHVKIKEETGLDAYLYDSFYNLAFMPVSYRDCKPHTVWRGCLQAVKELQDQGVHFLIESFGPFGTPQHGHPSSYNLENIFICYRVGVGNDYSTVPTGHPLADTQPDDARVLYYSLAHMAGAVLPLFIGKRRIDEVWDAQHRLALRDYNLNSGRMKIRYLQPDGKSVLWHDANREVATLWNFAFREVAIAGAVRDETAGALLPLAKTYRLEAYHTYTITAADLPVTI